MLTFQPSVLLLASITIGVHAQTKDLAITGARIELGDGKVISSGTVVIHDGKIAAVGENVTLPSGADVVDAKGMVLYPGFIDAYTTSGLNVPSAPTSTDRAPDSRNTAPASMWHGNRKGIRSDIICANALDLRQGVKDDNYKSGITTALLSPGSASVAGISTIVDYIDKGSVVVPQAAAELSFKSSGGGGGFGGGGGYPGTLFGITAVLRQTLADAQFYAAQDAPKKDVALDNLRPLMTGKMPALFSADSAREIVRATRVADEFSFRMILLGGREAYRDIDILKAKNLSVVVSVDPGMLPTEKPRKETADGAPQAVIDEQFATSLEHAQNVKKLNEAGIPFALSSLGNSADRFLSKMRDLIAFGVPRDAVLKGATSGSAAILGISDKVGTIEPGKLANLTLFNGDFADSKSEVQMVFVEGKKIQVSKVTAK